MRDVRDVRRPGGEPVGDRQRVLGAAGAAQHPGDRCREDVVRLAARAREGELAVAVEQRALTGQEPVEADGGAGGDREEPRELHRGRGVETLRWARRQPVRELDLEAGVGGELGDLREQHDRLVAPARAREPVRPQRDGAEVVLVADELHQIAARGQRLDLRQHALVARRHRQRVGHVERRVRQVALRQRARRRRQVCFQLVGSHAPMLPDAPPRPAPPARRA